MACHTNGLADRDNEVGALPLVVRGDKFTTNIFALTPPDCDLEEYAADNDGRWHREQHSV